MMKQIPNLFTLLNLFFGCVAIVFALQTGNVLTYSGESFSISLPEELPVASLFLFAAAGVDFLDGFVARMFNAASEMGKQLDSLADVVSFGAAPGVILYQLLRLSFLRDEGALDIPVIWLLPAFIVSCAAAYRLAKFNLDATQSYGFKGVPTPAVGLFVASLPLLLQYDGSGLLPVVAPVIINKWVLYVLIVVLSWLMVSNLPLMALKFKDWSFKNNMPKYLLLGIGILSAVIFKWAAVPVVFVAYIILSLALKNKNTP